MTRLALVVWWMTVACGQASTEPTRAAGGAAGGDVGGVAGSGGVGGVPASPGAGEASSSGGVGGACGEGSTELSEWPGSATVVTLDAEADFGSDLSGLTYESPGVLWAVNNLSAKLFRLVEGDAGYAVDAGSEWGEGKRLRFPDGQGIPDAEGVTRGEARSSGVYVSSERDLNRAETSRLSVLRYDAFAAGSTLIATHEWDVTALLPVVEPNTGLEAITWVEDAWLTAHGFVDESRGEPYDPRDYGPHGGGVFVVGVEQTSTVYGLALNHASGVATVVASITTPLAGVMGLEAERDSEELWAYCDDTCGNEAAVLALAESGHFELKRRFRAPSGLPSSNHEGIAVAPDSECRAGVKPFFWTDDADDGGFSLRRGELRCDCR